MQLPVSRRLSALVALPALVLAAACQPAEDAGDADSAVAAADVAVAGTPSDLTAEYMSHYNQHHADVLASYYSDDGLAIYADGTFAPGRAAIEAYHVAQFESNPTVNITVTDEMVFGDMAMAVGEWTVEMAPEGAEPMAMAGSWMAGYRVENGEWKVVRLITNYDREMPAELLGGMPPTEPPPGNSTMGDFAGAYEAAMSSGDAEALAGMFADDFWVAHLNQSPITDPAANLTALQGFAGAAMDIQGAETWDLGDGYAADGGRFVITPPGGEPVHGNYGALLHTEDGVTKIKWLVANGRPESLVPGAEM